MAGRGRGATLPAWMTSGDAAEGSGKANQGIDFSSQQFQDPSSDRHSGGRDRPRDHGSDLPPSRHPYDDRPNRDDRSDRKVKRSRSRSRDKPPAGRDRRGGRSPSPAKERTSSNWRPRKKSSNFDVRPPDGLELPPIGVMTPVNGVPNSYFSFTNNPLGILKDVPDAPTQQIDTSLHTRHARRVYAGGIPPTLTENEIVNFFNDVLYKATPAGTFTSPPAIKAYINVEKCYAFVEFTSMELATVCMEFDGIRFDHHTGMHILRIRRPNDYRPEIIPKLGPLPQVNMDFLATIGASGATGSGGKIFVGGIPYGISDEQIIELLSAFGPVKTFHQIRDPATSQTKGYGFCEYVTNDVADAAILGLNGLPLRDKVLTVRYATQNQLGNTSSGGGMSGGGGNMVSIPGQPQGMYIPANSHATLPAPSFNFPHSAIAQNTLANSIPTRVLKLSNMVTHDDLSNDAEYEEIKEDVRLECSDHGQVLSVVIPRLKDGYPPSTEGHIYVEFAITECAKMAAMALNGRKFADRTVVVQYFDELKYASRIFV